MTISKLAIAGAGLLAAISAPAMAKTCPSGQILRVSKGVCVSKTEAAKFGIHVAHAAAPKANVSTQARSEPDTTKVASAAGLDQTTGAAPAQTLAYTAPPAPAQPELDVRRNIAPFGALQFTGLRRD